MGRLRNTIDALDRVLRLAERALAERLREPVPDDFFVRFRAARWDTAGGVGRLVAIEQPARFDLDDLIGVDPSVERLVRNTEQFLRGLPANHVLLFGDRGTGKSSSVKGLLTRYGDRGLRVVEVHKSDLLDLPHVLEALRPLRRDFRFLIFCDDLSFDLGEAGYRELKAALEGSLEAPPDHVRVVVTSNRRHLIPETMADNRAARVDEHGDLQIGEVLDEKLALSDRFGLVLGFYAFDQPTYLDVVGHYARQAGVDLPWEEVRERALRWSVRRSSRSGRTARQFVDDLAGSLALDRAEGGVSCSAEDGGA
jgi:predicted AAA+ superfamily ATPase